MRCADNAGALGVRSQVLPADLSHAGINEALGVPGADTDAVEVFMHGLDTSVAEAMGARES